MSSQQTIVRRMEALLPPVTVRLLHAAGALASQAGVPLLLVGGSVRDLLLGRPVLDLDLAVEGDAPRLAAALAQELGGTVTARSQFGTAKLKTPDLTLDLASARRETYARPGALPTVAPGGLEEDLARRDFTINAMAVDLAPGAFGALRDPFDGQGDLERRTVRVLHGGSFADDATRILRATRYEARLGFRMDPDTEALARRDAHYLDAIGGDRLRRELERTFQEPQPEVAMTRSRDLGVLAAIQPTLGWPESHSQALARWRGEGERVQPLLFAALLASPLSPEEATALAKRLNAPLRWGRVIRDTVELRDRLPALEAPGIRPSQVAALLRGLEPTAMEAWAALAQEATMRQRLLDYVRRWRYVKSTLNGHDLLALGVPNGPAMGRLLAELLDARLDGLLRSRAEEEEFVRQALSRAL